MTACQVQEVSLDHQETQEHRVQMDSQVHLEELDLSDLPANLVFLDLKVSLVLPELLAQPVLLAQEGSLVPLDRLVYQATKVLRVSLDQRVKLDLEASQDQTEGQVFLEQLVLQARPDSQDPTVFPVTLELLVHQVQTDSQEHLALLERQEHEVSPDPQETTVRTDFKLSCLKRVYRVVDCSKWEATLQTRSDSWSVFPFCTNEQDNLEQLEVQALLDPRVLRDSRDRPVSQEQMDNRVSQDHLDQEVREQKSRGVNHIKFLD